MSMDSRRRQRLALTVLIGIIGSGVTPFTLAAPGVPTAPAASANGYYTVTPNGCNDYLQQYTCIGEWLEERVEPNGAFIAVSETFAGKPTGVYTYRSADMYCDWYYMNCTTRRSGTVSVVVGQVPGRDPLDVQLSYTYRARLGNVVGDAGTDILVERTSGGTAGNGVIDAVILRQGAGRSFTPVVPTSAQRSSTAWAASSLDVSVEDINVDGYVDVIVGNVATAIAGAYDQIVYSPGAPLATAPKGIRALDPALSQFAGNTLDYIVDNDYFLDNAPVTSRLVHFNVPYCPAMPDMGGYLGCYPVYIAYYVATPDYSVFDAAAVDIWLQENGLVQGTLTRANAVNRIATRIAERIGVALGGWDLDEILGGAGAHDDPLWRKGLEGFISIIGIATAHADEIDTDKAPRQVARQADVIYVTGRYIFGTGTEKLHSSIYYQTVAGAVPTWLSAFDSDLSLLGDGKLVAATNDPRDNPLLMRFTLGTVSPPYPHSTTTYFFTQLVGAHAHYRQLPASWLVDYDAIPEIPACGGCAGRNSNGYANGLIRATRGTAQAFPPLDFNAIVGWEYPVEPFYFGL